MPERDRDQLHEPLRRLLFRWVMVMDEQEGIEKGLPPMQTGNRHTPCSAVEVARNYGVPENILRNYLRNQIEEEESCRSLPFNMVMFIAYTCVVLGHSPCAPINAVDASITFDIEDNANFAFTTDFMGFKNLHDVNSHADFWSWIIKGFTPLMFVQEEFFAEGRNLTDPAILAKSGDLPFSQRGLLLNYNRIIGGIRLRQEVSEFVRCQSPDLLVPFYDRQCVGDVSGSGYELYPDLFDAKYTADPQREFWLWAETDVSQMIETLEEKEKSNWLDVNTKKIEITLPVFNGQYGVHSIIYVNFFWSRGGHIWKRLIPLSTYSVWFRGWWNYVADILWTLGLLTIISREFSNLCHIFRSKGGGWWGLYHDYLKFWNVVDWCTAIFGLGIILGFGIRYMQSSNINDSLIKLGDIDLQSDPDAYHSQAKSAVELLESEVQDAHSYRIVVGMYPLLIVLRLFKSFAHQPRLAVVSGTLSRASTDFVHFFLVFVSIFATYAICGIVLFGRELDEYANTLRSVVTCFRSMMGDFDWDELRQIGRLEAGAWFGSFMIIIVELLLNMALAIVIDAYTEEKDARRDGETLFQEFFQEIERWKGENTGDLVNLKEISRAVRAIKASDSFKKVWAQGHDATDSMSTAVTKVTKSKFTTASSSNMNVGPSEEFSLITKQSLVDACPMMQEEQAIDLIASAVFGYHKNNKGESNAEEMARSIRKVNHHTKRLKKALKKTLTERKAFASPILQQSGSFSEGIGTNMVKLDLSDVPPPWKAAGEKSVRLDLSTVTAPRPKTFAEQIGMCQRELRSTMEWIGDLELRDVGGTKLIRQPVEDLEWQILESKDDAEDFSIKRITDDAGALLQACRESEIDERQDTLRVQAAGRNCRVVRKDPEHDSLRCRIPGLGDVWFGSGALEHLRPPPKDALVLKMQQARAAGYGSNLDALALQDDDAEAEEREDETLRIVNDLAAEKRFGEQTVTEAINAVSELKWQQVKEKTDRSKLLQKIQGLKKKVISRHREHRKLAQETARQEERLEIVAKSRDEYRELVQNLMAEKDRLERRLGNLALHGHGRRFSLEDEQPHRDNGARRGNEHTKRHKNGYVSGSDDESYEQHARNMALRDEI